MEVKINREIMNYKEKIVLGLSLRQFFFSVLACLSALILYFSLIKYLNKEIVSWICVLSASPFALMGFIHYNGMTAEKVVFAWLKTNVLIPKHLVFRATNFYYELLKEQVENEC